MSFTSFELLLKQAMGLDTASISSAAVARAVKGRMEACEISDADAYEDLLRTSKAEMQELIETIIVPETWFFRDREAFATLGRLVLQEWASVRPGEALRLLSLPCSTGEEPYSMAMTLFDAGVAPQRFQIDAVDVSRRSLELARRGIYGKNSFRGDDLHFRDRYFESKPPGWQLAENVRRQVHFEPGNLIDANLLPGLHTYDAIFCRNVLIYFDREAQERVVETLERLLTPEGVLFMGPSETSLLPPDRFVPARLSHVFAFRKTKAEALKIKEKTESKSSARRRVVQARPLAPSSTLTRTKPRPFSSRITPPPASAPAPAPVDALDEVMRLSDQGRLAEASAQCEAYIHQQGPSARAYYLLGLIRDAGHRTQEAAEFYRKALYLDPQNEEVLAHLAALLKSQGDTAGAHLLLNRARRLTQRQRA